MEPISEPNTLECQSILTDSLLNYSLLEIQITKTQPEAFNIPKENQENPSPDSEKEIAIVIDKSGSMSGAYMQNTKDLVNKLVQHLWEKNLRKVQIIAFNHETEVLNVKKVKNEKEIEKFINDINASGGTLFTRVFMKIKEHLDNYLKSEKVRFLSISVFLVLNKMCLKFGL